MNQENENPGGNPLVVSAGIGAALQIGGVGNHFLFRANKETLERRLPLIAIPPMRHWTFGEDSGCPIQPGDTAWITVFPSADCLSLVAPFRVGAVVDRDTADEECGKNFDFRVPDESLTRAYIECLRDGLRGGLTAADHLAMESAEGLRLRMSYEPFELGRHLFAAGEPQEWEFPKFLDISEWAAANGISRAGRWSWQQLFPYSVTGLREMWQSAPGGFRRFPSGINPRKVKVRPAFTVVRE